MTLESIETLFKSAKEYEEKGEIYKYLETVQKIIELSPSYSNYLNIGKGISSLDFSNLDIPHHKRVKIALLSSFTVTPVAAYLNVESIRIGLFPEVYIGGFNQYQQEILDKNSKLYNFQPEITFLSFQIYSLLPEIDNYTLRKKGEIARIIKRITGLIDAFKKNTNSLLIVHNFEIPSYIPLKINKDNYSLKEWYNELNYKLAQVYENDSQIYILDYDHLTAIFGKLRTTNPKMHYLASMEISESFLPMVINKYMGYIKALKGLSKKCIVLDLDNTLWGGIVGENGMNELRLSSTFPGNEYYEFQKLLLHLFNRGIILAINSRNNYENSMEVIRNHPFMILREKHFASIQINWLDKVTNMKTIAQELNIGLDSMVFIDDNPVERELMKEMLPEVLTVDLPRDAALYKTTIENLNDFEILSITEEDLKRGEIYSAQRLRKEFEKSSASVEKFLKGLKMQLIVKSSNKTKINLPRVAQLTQRTNQFNLTTKRYKESDLTRFLDLKSYRIYTLQVIDKFGDNGLVGVAIIKTNSNMWEIDTLLMSCRVLGRTIETLFLDYIVQEAKKENITIIKGEYIPTKKNVLVKNFYLDYGFKLIEETDEHVKFQLDVKSKRIKFPAWIKFKTEG